MNKTQTSSAETKVKVQEWLQTQGYPLEMHVASAFKKAGFYDRLSEYYTDFETGQAREVDLVASRISNVDYPFITQVVYPIQCKLSSDKPWVVFSTASSGAQTTLRVVPARK